MLGQIEEDQYHTKQEFLANLAHSVVNSECWPIAIHDRSPRSIVQLSASFFLFILQGVYAYFENNAFMLIYIYFGVGLFLNVSKP